MCPVPPASLLSCGVYGYETLTPYEVSVSWLLFPRDAVLLPRWVHLFSFPPEVFFSFFWGSLFEKMMFQFLYVFCLLKNRAGTFLVIQSLRICLSRQGTKIPHAMGQLSPGATAREPERCNDSVWPCTLKCTHHSTTGSTRTATKTQSSQKYF